MSETKTTVKKKAARRKAPAKKSTSSEISARNTANDMANMDNAPMSPIAQITKLKEMGIEVSEMRELLALQKEYDEMQATQAYNDALALFKAENVIIEKDKTVKYETDRGGITEYQHSSLANIIETIVPFMSKYGLSHNWKTEQADGLVKVTCCLTHRQGHKECTTLMSNPDNSGGKNSIQAIASAVKYLERYTLTALLGLAEKDMYDDDGRTYVDAEAELMISQDQETKLRDLITETGADEAKFLQYMRVGSLADITAGEYDKAEKALLAKKAATEDVPQ